MNSSPCFRRWSRWQLRLVVFGQIGSLFLGSTSALANPLGGTVVGGAAAIQSAGNTLSVRQSTDRAVINWQGFSINKGEVTKFIQPSSNSAVLNRVTSANPSTLLGSLQANGKVYLINPNGILIGPGANINVGAFAASTLDVNPQQFMRGGDVRFQGNSHAPVVNLGTIRAVEGDVYLIGAHVVNQGTIQAPNGVAALVAAQDVTLVDGARPLLAVRPSADSLGGTGVTNTGTIEAVEARLVAASGNVYALAINNTGRIYADGAKVEGGKVLLVANGGKIETSGELIAKTGQDGGQVTIDAGGGGSVTASGHIKASGDAAQAGSVGGQVQITGQQVELRAAAIEASGSAGGGKVLVGGDFQGTNAQVLNATNTTLDAASTIRADAWTNGNGGQVAVWADNTNRTAATISAQGGSLGGNGGYVEISGKSTLVFGGQVSTLAPRGQTGMLLLDPTNFTIDATQASSLQTTLATSDVTLQTQAAGSQPGDIFVNASISWSGNTSLTLSAHHDISIASGVTIAHSGAGNLTLRADSTGTGLGTVIFNGTGRVNFAGSTGKVDILYNPTSYASPTNFGSSVTMGSGTFRALMLVNDVNQLQAINTNLSGNYALGRDIDASATATWNSGAGFAPVGIDYAAFTGALDGLGHTITGLTINRPGTDYVGLFGDTSASSTVQNVGLVGGNITGKVSVGTLMGHGSGSISNCYSTGAVSGSEIVGGLVGMNDGTITTSYSTNTVSGNDYVGGLVGKNFANVTTSYSTSTVSGNDYVGGLVGLQYVDCISNSYSTGAVSGHNLVGGLVGVIFGTGSISNCYSTSAVSGETYVGGLVGSNWFGSISNSYSTGAVSGHDHVGGLVGGNFASVTTSYSTGAVSGHDYVGGLVGWNNGSIANSYSTGGVSGNNYVGGLLGSSTGDITSSFSTGVVSGSIYVGGLVGWSSGNITNSSSTGLVSGALYVGGLVGSNNGSISNSYGTGNVSGMLGYIGGLVGENDAGSITSCHSTGNVSGSSGVGGLVGGNRGTGSISNSYSTSAVSGGNVGGLVGFNFGSISDSYSAGSVGGDGALGGLVGWNRGSITRSYSTAIVSGAASGSHEVGGLVGINYGSISNSYSTGAVLGGDNVGGLVGKNDAGSITSCHSTGAVSGSIYVGGLVGWNSGNITNSSSTGTVSGALYVGGLVGTNSGSISNSYGTGNVSGILGYIGGLVGENEAGSITSCHSTGNVSGSSGVGGLVGGNRGTGSISNSYSTSAVSGGNVGGLVGFNFGSISDSYSVGSVGGDGALGGLVGWNRGRITRSYSTAIVSGAASGSHEVGGLVGINYGSIANSFSTGAVLGGDNVGGLVGWNYQGTITNSYSAGKVTGNSAVGGLVGSNYQGIIRNSLWDLDTSRQALGVGSGSSEGTTGFPTDLMVWSLVFTNRGWDFVDTWSIIESASYPGLRWSGFYPPANSPSIVDSPIPRFPTAVAISLNEMPVLNPVPPTFLPPPTVIFYGPGLPHSRPAGEITGSSSQEVYGD